MLHSNDPSTLLILLTTDRPAGNSAGSRALDMVTGPNKPVRAVIGMLSQKDLDHLKSLATGDPPNE